MTQQLNYTAPVGTVGSAPSPGGNGSDRPAESSGSTAIVSAQEAQSLNMRLIEHMLSILGDSRKQANNLYSRLRWTYWIIITLATLMFLVGLALISAPMWAPFVGQRQGIELTRWQTLIPAGLGILDLIGLFLFNPIARIQKLMGDMSQLIVILDGFQVRVALRLVEVDGEQRPTIGAGAEHVASTVQSSLKLIETFFEKWLSGDLERKPRRET